VKVRSGFSTLAGFGSGDHTCNEIPSSGAQVPGSRF
jgi:hypothetical protein